MIKELGNTAAHGRSAVPFQKAVTSLRELFHFSYWLARSYAKGAKPGVALAFSADALTRTTSVLTKTLAQLQEIGSTRRTAHERRHIAVNELLDRVHRQSNHMRRDSRSITKGKRK